MQYFNKLEGEVGRWVQRMGMLSPTALAVAKAAINTDQVGSTGIVDGRAYYTIVLYE